MGLHEGDWEMIQLRLDDAASGPDLAVYAQHKTGEALFWPDVEKVAGERPVIYVARGSHAAYFSAGRHWQGRWWDHADGKGFAPELTLEIAHDEDPAFAWMRWPGLWGDTKPNPDELVTLFDATSPRGPGGHGHWKDPHRLLAAIEGHEYFEVAPAISATAPQPAPPRPPAPPTGVASAPSAPAIALARGADGQLLVDFDSEQWPAGLVPRRLIVTANAPEDPHPPEARRVDVDSAQGRVTVPIQLDPARSYEIQASIAGQPTDAPVPAPPLTSEATTAPLPPAGA
jgi:hypothetical protein